MSVLLFGATVDGIGRLKFDVPELVAFELAKIAGKHVNVHVKRERDVRTVAQNSYLWSHVYSEAVAESTGLVELATGCQVFQTRDDVHGFAKLELLRRPIMTNRGELNLLGTTTTLTPEEFSKYTEMVCAKLASFGVYIPER